LAIFAKEDSETKPLNAALMQTKGSKAEGQGAKIADKSDSERFVSSRNLLGLFVLIFHCNAVMQLSLKGVPLHGKRLITLSLFLEVPKDSCMTSMDMSNLVL
jgi:hypothetical protein